MNAPSRLPILIEEVESRRGDFAKILPSTINPTRFVAAVKTALHTVPGLTECDRRSVVMACMKCAGDGLVPDGRDAILVVGTTKKDGQWVKQAQYWPMVQGLQKIAYRSGFVTRLDARLVHQGDVFELTLGSDARIVHKPVFGEARGDIVGAYAVATLKNASPYVEWMELEELVAIMRRSKGFNKQDNEPKGPWLTDFGEMARKTVMRRALKWLPNDAVSAQADDETEPAPDAETAETEMLANAIRTADAEMLAETAWEPSPLTAAGFETGAVSQTWKPRLQELHTLLASCPGRDAVERTWEDWDASWDEVPPEVTAKAKEMVDARLYEMAKG